MSFAAERRFRRALKTSEVSTTCCLALICQVAVLQTQFGAREAPDPIRSVRIKSEGDQICKNAFPSECTRRDYSQNYLLETGALSLRSVCLFTWFEERLPVGSGAAGGLFGEPCRAKELSCELSWPIEVVELALTLLLSTVPLTCKVETPRARDYVFVSVCVLAYFGLFGAVKHEKLISCAACSM